ncbi:MAG: ribonuclease activity regulator RraA [Alphaproteobacteria bacterium]
MSVQGGLSDEVKALFAATTTATLCTQLFKRGLRNQLIQGVGLVTPKAGMMIGEAFTLRNIPAREDLDGPGMFTGREHPQRRAIEECPAGAVLAIDCRKDTRSGALGDILVTRLADRGVAGAVTDGGMRDIVPMADFTFPVYAACAAPPASFHVHHAVDLQVPIACGDVAIFPGDILVGDAEGVVVVPKHLAEEVARDSAEQERMENWVLKEIAKGQSIFGLYPPNDDNKQRYEAERSKS